MSLFVPCKVTWRACERLCVHSATRCKSSGRACRPSEAHAPASQGTVCTTAAAASPDWRLSATLISSRSHVPDVVQP
eukprot:1053678-Prymnesium_polylepis.1